MYLHETVVSHDFNFIYLRIPKNVTSTIQYWVAVVHNLPRTTGAPKYINQMMDKLENDEEFFEKENYTKFLVIRNPMKRCISAYCGKFIKRHLDIEANKLVNNDLKTTKDVSQISFKKTLEEMLKLSKEELEQINSHWRPQYTFFKRASINNFDHVILQDNFSQEFNQMCEKEGWPKLEKGKKINTTNYIFEKYNGKVDKIPAYKLLNIRGAAPRKSQFLTHETKEMMEELFKTDLKIYKNLKEKRNE